MSKSSSSPGSSYFAASRVCTGSSTRADDVETETRGGSSAASASASTSASNRGDRNSKLSSSSGFFGSGARTASSTSKSSSSYSSAATSTGDVAASSARRGDGLGESSFNFASLNSNSSSSANASAARPRRGSCGGSSTAAAVDAWALFPAVRRTTGARKFFDRGLAGPLGPGKPAAPKPPPAKPPPLAPALTGAMPDRFLKLAPWMTGGGALKPIPNPPSAPAAPPPRSSSSPKSSKSPKIFARTSARTMPTSPSFFDAFLASFCSSVSGTSDSRS